MKLLLEYIDKNRDRFLNELLEFLRIPSISNDADYKNDLWKAAQFASHQLESAGVDRVEIFKTEGFPVVYGEKIVDDQLPTVLVYGHYDVQPPDPLELWNSPPFEPVIKKTGIHPEGAIFARGACDDKGQLFMHIKAFEAMNKLGDIPCNIKFMLEGEEEVGSAHLGDFCKTHKDLLSCDVVLISDTAMISNKIPSITVGVRGLCYLEVELIGPKRDLHSGVYGGMVVNPINALCDMVASLMDENHRITIPGFYNDVEELSNKERRDLNEAPFDSKGLMFDLDIKELDGEEGYTPLEHTSIRPTLDVNGIWGGYTGKGAKTVIPSKANAKISMRLVPHQKPEKVFQQFKDYFEKIAPPSMKLKVINHHGGLPVVTPTETVEYKAAHHALLDSFGIAPVAQRSGGSIPIIALFETILGVKSVLLGFGLDSDAIHSPNEHFGLFNFYKGIETIPLFYKHYANLKQNQYEENYTGHHKYHHP